MPKNRVAIAIRNATKKYLAAVEKWLRTEREQTGEGFFCNWSVIANACKRKDLFVLAAALLLAPPRNHKRNFASVLIHDRN